MTSIGQGLTFDSGIESRMRERGETYIYIYLKTITVNGMIKDAAYSLNKKTVF